MSPVDLGKILVFSSSGILCGVDLGKVIKLIEEKNVTPIPRSDQRVKGVVFHEGKAVPVFRSGRLETAEKSEKLILMLDQSKGPVGLSVDQVVGIITEEDLIRDIEGKQFYKGTEITVIGPNDIVAI